MSNDQLEWLEELPFEAQQNREVFARFGLAMYFSLRTLLKYLEQDLFRLGCKSNLLKNIALAMLTLFPSLVSPEILDDLRSNPPPRSAVYALEAEFLGCAVSECLQLHSGENPLR